jgi:hypothetical protein
VHPVRFAALAVILLGAVEACGGSPGSPRQTPTDAGVDATSESEDASVVTEDSDVAQSDAAETDGSQVDEGGDGAIDAGLMDANGPPFPCGPAMACYELTQFCSHVTGAHGGDFYDCNASPTACAGTLSCTCLAGQGIVSPCGEDGGGITVTATE